jgi:hypothetical protein
LNALTEPQIDNVLLAQHLFGYRRGCKRGQRETAKQQDRRMLMV